jgi:ArsR family metal-binding transcriptional regulator
VVDPKFSYQQIKMHLTIITRVTNPLDDILEALQNIQDAIDTIKTRKTVTSEKQTLQDYDRIISYLEDGAASLLNAVVLFQNYEKPL